jgi:UDP-N-acetylmuramoyl-L-alanyl-D-glutamate--2,6-diaminopimelate ligase
MKLNELLSVLNEYSPSQVGSTEVLGITADAREVKPQFVFVAVQGLQKDGHDFIPEARSRGACFIIAQKPDQGSAANLSSTLIVASTREALILLAEKFYQYPTENIFSVGVTGTNGKTSTTYFLEHLFNSQNFSMGVIGTINHHLQKKVWPSSHTTPDPMALASRISEMKLAGAKAIAMEVSSHALDQQRVDGIQFNAVVFTNLTRDHLDYHKTMENYFAAKQRLFWDLLVKPSAKKKLAVINIDDDWGRSLKTPTQVKVLTYGQQSADFQIINVQESFSGCQFQLVVDQAKWNVHLPMMGLHNVYNAVGSLAVAHFAGLNLKECIESLSMFSGVPGRMQSIKNNNGISVFVDYAHTPDALENILKVVLRIKKLNKLQNKIWTVFGCGGDRDNGKRPLMGKIAAELSDQVIVTSDNPRSENPEQIISQILAGVPSELKSKCIWQVDRKQAIEEALVKAQKGDVVLIAGKGHEDYQILGDQKIHFDDAVIARGLLNDGN